LKELLRNLQSQKGTDTLGVQLWWAHAPGAPHHSSHSISICSDLFQVNVLVVMWFTMVAQNRHHFEIVLCLLLNVTAGVGTFMSWYTNVSHRINLCYYSL
jgi:hypothetical protein